MNSAAFNIFNILTGFHNEDHRYSILMININRENDRSSNEDYINVGGHFLFFKIRFS